MIGAVVTAIGSLLALIVIIARMFSRKKAERRKQAEQARKDLDNANKPDGTSSDFLDGFGGVR